MSIINNFPNAIGVSQTTLFEKYALKDNWFYNNEGVLVEGIMSNNSSQTNYLNYSGAVYTIPEGYQDGNSVVIANVNDTYGADVSNTTLLAKYALEGYGYYNSSGVWTEGTMPNNSSQTVYLTYSGDSYTIPAGYQDGNSTVVADVEMTGTYIDVSDTTLTATYAVSPDSEYFFFNSSGVKTYGTMTIYPTSSAGNTEIKLTPSSTSYTISKGNHGSGTYGYERVYFDWYSPSVTPISSQQTISDSTAFIGEAYIEAAPNLNGGDCVVYELDSSIVTSDAIYFSGSDGIDMPALMPYINNAYVFIYATTDFTNSTSGKNYLMSAISEVGSSDFLGSFACRTDDNSYVGGMYFSCDFIPSGTGIAMQIYSDPYLFEPDTNYHMICIISN